MALPMMNTPTYTMVVPSSGVSVRYRPFLVKEEKALLIAQQSEDVVTMIETLKKVVKSCVQDQLDVEKLATFDLEYMFTQIRGKSVGETVELIMSCDEDHGEQNKLAKVKVSVDLSEIKVDAKDDHSKKLSLWGDVGVVMKYPSVDIIKKFQTVDESDTESVFGIISQSIDYIFDSTEMYYAKDQTKEELLEFLNNLTTDQFSKIQKFFETMPKLTYDIDYSCPVCSKAHHVRLEGMDSFF